LEAAHTLRAEGFRVEIDSEDTALSAKIRKAQNEKVPFMLVLGGKEKDQRTVTPRLRTGAQLGAWRSTSSSMSLDAADRPGRTSQR